MENLEEYEPQQATEYVESYASTEYRDDLPIAIGCGVVAVIVMFLTILALVVTLWAHYSYSCAP